MSNHITTLLGRGKAPVDTICSSRIQNKDVLLLSLLLLQKAVKILPNADTGKLWSC